MMTSPVPLMMSIFSINLLRRSLTTFKIVSAYSGTTINNLGCNPVIWFLKRLKCDRNPQFGKALQGDKSLRSYG